MGKIKKMNIKTVKSIVDVLSFLPFVLCVLYYNTLPDYSNIVDFGVTLLLIALSEIIGTIDGRLKTI